MSRPETALGEIAPVWSATVDPRWIATTPLIGRCAATEGQELADVYHDQCDVVLLSHRGGLPSADLGEQSVC